MGIASIRGTIKVLTDKEIKGLMKEKKIQLKPFYERCLGPVSYDVGTTIEDTADFGIYKLVSHEEIKLSRDIAGIIGERSRIANYSLFASFSPLIDPGFKGHLIFLVQDPFYQLRNVQEELGALFQIMFFRVGEVDVAYNERKTSTGMDRKGFTA